MKITLPEGFKMPENVRPGEPFEVTATIRPMQGTFALVAIDGMELDMEEDEEEVPERMDGSRVKLPFGEDESEEYA